MNYPDNLTAHDWQHIEGTAMQDETPSIPTQGVVSAGNHTPGPWVTTIGSDEAIIVTSTHDADGLDDDVALVYGGNDAIREIAEANARLIAAAPDLLAALQLVSELHMNDLEPDEVNWPFIEAAIAKALGE